MPPGTYMVYNVGTVQDTYGVSYSASNAFEVSFADPCEIYPLESTIGQTDSIPTEIKHTLGAG